ncbi:gp11 [Bacillus phage G]|uniref:Gp11 n=1 Tax=Bacillus phage G TaxID=2884420 RepID=G3MB81_9CAUD|nr:gp11 [Bacillus phage G]AEO93282.1 gp11 [Bacillus phage G]
MKNKSVSSSNKGFAGWIEDFITGLANKEANLNNQNTEEEVLAEINLKDLDKVVWKEESFGVHFDEKGASLINEFGNVVRTLQDCKTIEEVDKQLNSSEVIVASDEGFDDEEEDLTIELDKIANSLAEENVEMTNTTPEHVDNSQNTVVPEQTEQVNQTEQTTTASTEDETEKVEEKEDDAVIAAIADGFEQLEANVAALTERLALIEQEYARNPVIEDISTNSNEEEVKHFTETADETAKNIANENAVDITSPAGRVELSNQSKETSEVQDIVTQDTPKTTENVELTTEESTEQELKQEDSEAVEEVKEEKPEENKEEEKTANTQDNEDIEEEPKVEKLAGVAEKIFQKGICPESGEELVKSKTVGNFLGVYSTAGVEYAVDLNSGEIFKYLK